MPTLSKADNQAKVSQNEARRRKEVALAGIRELELLEKEAKLIPADRVREVWVKALSIVKSGVLRIPDKLAPQVVSCSGAHEARELLAKECEDVLRGLHDELVNANL